MFILCVWSENGVEYADDLETIQDAVETGVSICAEISARIGNWTRFSILNKAKGTIVYITD